MSDKRKPTTGRRASANRKINRAQKKAIEVRAAESRAVIPAVAEIEAKTGVASSGSRARARRRLSQTVAPKPAPLSRAQEYAYIRSDFRRLLITASSLLAVMLVLLFVID